MVGGRVEGIEAEAWQCQATQQRRNATTLRDDFQPRHSASKDPALCPIPSFLSTGFLDSRGARSWHARTVMGCSKS